MERAERTYVLRGPSLPAYSPNSSRNLGICGQRRTRLVHTAHSYILQNTMTMPKENEGLDRTAQIVFSCSVWWVPSGIQVQVVLITKTCLYNFDPLKPHFYTVKLGFIGIYIIFLFRLKKKKQKKKKQSIFLADFFI